MNRIAIIVGLVLLAAAGFGWYQYGYLPQQEAAEAARSAEDEAARAAEEARLAAEAAREEAAEAARADEDAAAEAAAAAAAAADAATEAASDAAAAAAAATQEAARTAGEAASSAADAAVEAARQAAAAATLAARNAADAAGELLPEDLLRVETYDRARVDAMIDSSDLDPATKERLKNTIEAAEATPELLGSALETVRTSLGVGAPATDAR
ncbi:hypothetical protein ORIO_01635 [Cereibacter azotoformans]|uniref:Mucin-associated surface protein n=1 Tax=Cereibacter sphaeroides (strain ATCC 17025 / ATH 2.4.3) TaxID=349102 RepID=A4WPC6_CERS5|nr:hypothetical protein [Cereibacter azotoformans]ULB08638.1 hypothetical protein ORIO_01635 [Cereibacter azotoformans]